MKIAIIHHQYAKKGGMESYLFDLIAGFGKENDSVNIITYRQDKNSPVAPNCTIEKHQIFLPKSWQKFFFLRDINKNFDKKKYDLSLSLCRTKSQDITISGGTHKGYLKHLKKIPRLKDLLEIYFEKKSYTNSPYIIAHSKMLQNEIETLYGINKDKIHLLYPPVNNNKFHSSIKNAKLSCMKEFGISTNKTILLFPSTGHKRKGWYELLKALKKLPESEFELVIAGRKINCIEKIKNIRMLGFIDDMAKLYAAVDFTILPSYYEPFGLVVPESLQCKTPVIISDNVGAKDFVTKNDGVIFSDVNWQNIHAAILKAREQKFFIANNFVEEHNLTIGYHIKMIKSI